MSREYDQMRSAVTHVVMSSPSVNWGVIIDGSGQHMTTSWHVNDTVAYDSMQERHTMLTYLLITLARTASDTDAAVLRDEMVRWKNDTLAVDGYDRRAIDEHTALIDARVQELTAQPA